MRMATSFWGAVLVSLRFGSIDWSLRRGIKPPTEHIRHQRTKSGEKERSSKEKSSKQKRMRLSKPRFFFFGLVLYR